MTNGKYPLKLFFSTRNWDAWKDFTLWMMVGFGLGGRKADGRVSINVWLRSGRNVILELDDLTRGLRIETEGSKLKQEEIVGWWWVAGQCIWGAIKYWWLELIVYSRCTAFCDCGQVQPHSNLSKRVVHSLPPENYLQTGNSKFTSCLIEEKFLVIWGWKKYIVFILLHLAPNNKK
jgi:hypothetical protein